jgi:hypothetical protein
MQHSPEHQGARVGGVIRVCLDDFPGRDDHADIFRMDAALGHALDGVDAIDERLFVRG